ncbi:DUF4091 domain-containing protein [Pseudonocardia sichuanensis]
MRIMLHAWSAPSTRRFFPSSPAEEERPLRLAAARGERVAFQVVFRTGEQPCTVSAAVSAPIPATLRRVGYVPVEQLTAGVPAEEIDGLAHLPGPAPDPLLEQTEIPAGPHETHSFWITAAVPPAVGPGAYEVRVALRPEGGEPRQVSAVLDVHRAVLPPREGFPVTNWLYADALCDHYGVEPFGDRFWQVLDPYLRNNAEHGSDTMYVPLLTPALDGVKRPTQLLGVHRDGDGYRFDWTLVQRWIRACRAHGISGFEWSHLFTQWGAAHAPRVYEGHGAGGRALWADGTGATSPTYEAFLARLLPELERFLDAEGLVGRSWFHLSDEPSGDEALANYRAARQLLRTVAPWMRVTDALSDVRFAAEGLIDVPVPIVETAPEFLAGGFPAWAYFCNVPRGHYVNRLMDTPLPKLRMLGWLLHRSGAQGFLHWGYNYWYRHLTSELVDPYRVTDGGRALPSGDCFAVYPGESGPVDSTRWEVFAESLQDLALLRHSGVGPQDPLLGELHDFARFPRDPRWVGRARRHVLDRVAAVQARD